MSEFTHLVDQARALSIFIGHVTDGPEIPTIVARSITIASLLALVGGAAFVMVVWWPVIDADPSAETNPSTSEIPASSSVASAQWDETLLHRADDVRRAVCDRQRGIRRDRCAVAIRTI